MKGAVHSSNESQRAQNIKNILVAKGIATSLRTDNENIKVVDSFCLLDWLSTIKEPAVNK